MRVPVGSTTLNSPDSNLYLLDKNLNRIIKNGKINDETISFNFERIPASGQKNKSFISALNPSCKGFATLKMF